MKTILIFGFLIGFMSLNLNSQTTILSGNIYGTWTKSGSPYKIMGQVTIPKDSLLKIEPGVVVEFQGAYKMHVYGSLQAIGKAGDTVVFTSANKTTGWSGFHFHKNKTIFKDSNLLQWCKFEYFKNTAEQFGRGMFRMDTITNIGFRNCLFQNNKATNGVCIYGGYSSFYVYNSIFRNNEATSDLTTAAATNGSAINLTFGRIVINNCNFINNLAHLPLNSNDSAGALSRAALSLINCRIKISHSGFYNNMATGNAAIVFGFYGDSLIEIENCIFRDNKSKNAGIVGANTSYNTATVYFRNIKAINNKPINNMFLGQFLSHAYAGSKLNIDHLEAYGNWGNTIEADGGIIKNSKIQGSQSGVFTLKSSLHIHNSIITNNLLGVAPQSSGSKILVSNSVVAYNGSNNYLTNTQVGGLFASSSSTPNNYSVYNSIVQKNRNGNQMYNITAGFGGSVLYLKNSIVEGGKDSAKAVLGSSAITISNYGNIINDTVQFVKPPKGIGIAYADSTCDFHPVQTCSKTFIGLNGGLNVVSDGSSTLNLALASATDLEGNPRIRCGTVDIGPYELEGSKTAVSVYKEPLDTLICPKTAAVIAPETCGAGINGYQWQGSSDGNSFANINGANSLTLKTDSTVKAGDRYYRLIISQSECNKKDTSRAVKISFKPGSTIAITQQPKDTQICAGTNFNLQAGILGTSNTYQWQKSTNGTLFNNLSGATTNPFSQKITDSSWYRLLIANTVCASSKDTTKAAKVIKLPAPKPNLGFDQTIPNGGNAVLNPGTFSAYSWYKGATTPTYTVDKSNLDTGKNTVWVEVTDAKGCKGRDTVIIDLRPVNGLKSITEAGIKLYPVPANEVLNLSVPNTANSKDYSYELLDLQGKVIIPLTHISDSNTAINLRNIPTGVYVFTIEAQGNYYSAKLMKR